MINRLNALALACVLTAVAAPALAQDASQTANFGEVRLSAGFTPDPHTVSMVAGGGIDASRLGNGCVGKISSAPDYQVTYSAGGLPLVFRTRSGEDTTLVINGPNGSWRCDDDSYGDGDAEVRFNNPQSGVYDIWVGTYGSTPAQARLLITETP